MKVNRWIIAAVLAAAIAAGCSRQADISGTGLIRLDERVYAWIAPGPSSVEGLGANSGFIVGDESVLVVDSRFSYNHARQLLEAIRSITDLPVSYLVNTHYHPDHVWGNSIFRAEGAIILARPETKIEMERFSPIYRDYYRDRKPDVFEMIKDVEPALPDSFVADELRLDLGGIEAVVTYFGPGHTAGDLVVAVPSRRIVFTGGLVSNGYHPNMGDQGADFENWLITLDRLDDAQPKIVVPGQGQAGYRPPEKLPGRPDRAHRRCDKKRENTFQVDSGDRCPRSRRIFPGEPSPLQYPGYIPDESPRSSRAARRNGYPDRVRPERRSRRVRCRHDPVDRAVGRGISRARTEVAADKQERGHPRGHT